MEPAQLGILSASLLRPRASEAPRLSASLPSTTFPTRLLAGATPAPLHTRRVRGWGRGSPPTPPSPSLRVTQAPGSAIKTGPTLPRLPLRGGHSEESYPNPLLGTSLRKGRRRRMQKPGGGPPSPRVLRARWGWSRAPRGRCARRAAELTRPADASSHPPATPSVRPTWGAAGPTRCRCTAPPAGSPASRPPQGP